MPPPVRRKKKFIDKKQAVTYYLAPKTDEDPLHGDSGCKEGVMQEEDKGKRLEEQRKYGIFFEDEYNYLQHLKDLSEVHDWVEVPKRGKTAEASPGSPSFAFESAMETEVYVDKGSTVYFDPEMAAALEEDVSYQDGDDELEDDFIIKANAAGDEQDGETETFDDGYSLAEMMREGMHSKSTDVPFNEGSQEEIEDNTEDEDEETDDEFTASDDMEFNDPEGFSFEEGKTSLPQYSLTSSVLPRNEQLQLLDARFEKLYEDYGPENIGALDHEELNGRLTVSSDLMKQALEDLEKYKEVTTMKDIVDSVDEDTKSITKQWQDNSEEEYEWRAIPTNKPKWDCESIRSLYSTTSNLPTTVYHDNPDNKKKKKRRTISTESSDTTQQHLTLQDVEKQTLEDRRADRASTFRPKGETPEERQTRKKAVKFEQQERRKEKKANKMAFRAEHVRQQKEMVALHRNVKALSLSTNG